MAFGRGLVSVLAIIFSFSAYSVLASELQDASFRQQSCGIGVCFAIDGSESISPRDFWRQTFLARKIMANIPTSLSASFAAVQYGRANLAISGLTTDRDFIRRELKDAEQLFSRETFLTAGINFCFSELFDVVSGGPICRRSFIVVMGNGNVDIGADPVERARLFESEVSGGDVLAVRFGSGANVSQLRDISGRSDFFDASTTGIRSLAAEIVESFGN